VDKALVGALRKAGHQVTSPAEAQLASATDPRHLEYAIKNRLALLTADQEDFLDLHDLILAAQGRHYGILLVATTTIRRAI
jgi:hypothetical protein